MIVRLTPAELRQIEAVAGVMGQSISAFARWATLTAAGPIAAVIRQCDTDSTRRLAVQKIREQAPIDVPDLVEAEAKAAANRRARARLSCLADDVDRLGRAERDARRDVV